MAHTMRRIDKKMSVNPKEQNEALQRLIGANKERLAHTQKVIRDLQKRADIEGSKTGGRKVNGDKGP
jgi:hypothetical protein